MSDSEITDAYEKSLPNYNKNAKCPKCVTHKPQSKYMTDKGEYMKRTCSVCGYSWDERCHDRNQK